MKQPIIMASTRELIVDTIKKSALGAQLIKRKKAERDMYVFSKEFPDEYYFSTKSLK